MRYFYFDGEREVIVGNRHTLSIFLEIVAIFAIPIILAVEMYYFSDSTAVSSIILTIISVALFMLSFETRRPSVANLVPTAVFSALGAAGRIAFAPFAYVKPVSAVAIFAGAFLGRHAGFLVGAISALLSNVFFGQGSWTPWQMYAWGLVGYLGGLLAAASSAQLTSSVNPDLPQGEKPNKFPPFLLMIWAFISGPFFGLVMNIYFVIGFVHPLTIQSALLAFMASLPFDVTHGVATLVFLILLWLPWQQSVNRILTKYNLTGRSFR